MSKWTEEEIIIAKELLEKGLSYKEISEKINRSDMSIRAKLANEFNIKRTDYHSFRIDKNCLNCNKKFNVTKGNDRKYNHKFCSNSCSATFNNKKKIKKIKYCIQCNSILNNSNKYCNNTCLIKHKHTKIINQWLNNEITGNVEGGSYCLLKCIREYLLNTNNYTCSECPENRINPYSGKSILTIDHIDGDASNNRPDNLKVLCPSCHAMTSTYGTIDGRISARKDYRKKYRPSILQ